MAKRHTQRFSRAHCATANAARNTALRAVAWSLVVFACVISHMAMAADESQAGGAYVLHAEPVAIRFEDADGFFVDAREKSLAANSKTKFKASFEAFGRRFLAELEPHQLLNALAREHGGGATALRGTLAGVNQSWVRLTQVGDALHGIVWDGEQLLAIAPASEVSANKTTDAGTMIFRLADTVIDPAANTCAAASADASGVSMFDSLKSELQAKSIALPPHSQLRVSVMMDRSYLERYESQQHAIDALLVRANNVDGIFTAQLGVGIIVSAMVAEDATDAANLTNTTKAGDLLAAVGRARAANAELYSAGITHLFTGRDLDGNTVGISYVGAVCSQRYGAALSEARGRDAWYESLIAAHELGHSFGAEHDGVGECAATPTTFLMAPVIGNSDRFSQCSLDRIQQHLSKATCLTPLTQPDAAIAGNLGEHRATAASTFTWTMAVTNLGTGDALGTRVDISLPAQMSVHSATIDGQACSVGAGVIACAAGRLPSQVTLMISVTATTQFAGSYAVTAKVESDADADANNNNGQGSILIEAAPSPIAPAPTPAPANTASNEPIVTPDPPQAAEGGGGPMSTGWLLALLALMSRRRASPLK